MIVEIRRCSAWWATRRVLAASFTEVYTASDCQGTYAVALVVRTMLPPDFCCFTANQANLIVYSIPFRLTSMSVEGGSCRLLSLSRVSEK